MEIIKKCFWTPHIYINLSPSCLSPLWPTQIQELASIQIPVHTPAILKPLVLAPPTSISDKPHAPQHSRSLLTSPSQTVDSVLCQPAHSKLHGLNHQNFDLLSIHSSSSSASFFPSSFSTQALSMLKPCSGYSPLTELPPQWCLVVPWACSDWTRSQPSPFASESLWHRRHGSEGVEEGEEEKGGRGRDATQSRAAGNDEVKRRHRIWVILDCSRGVFTCPGEEGTLSHPPVTSGRRGVPLHSRGRSARTMRLGLVALVMIFLNSMDHDDALKLSKAKRLRRGEFLCLRSTAALTFSFISLSLSFVPSNCLHHWRSSQQSDSQQ